MTLEKGFVSKSFAQVKAEIEDSLVDALGEVNLVAPSVFANIIGVFAERESQLWDMLAAIYNSGVPNMAEGYSLDAVCALNGIKRLGSTYSTAIGQITATNYTKVAKNTKVAVKTSGKVFLLDNDITLTNEKCYQVRLEITNNEATSYVITLNGSDITYNRTTDKTRNQIAEELVILINDAVDSVIAKSDGSDIIITSKDALVTFICFASTNIKIIDVTNNASFTAEEKGSIAVPANSLTEIKTPIFGLLAVNNIASGKTGTNIETDIALRQRRMNSLSLSGSGTLESIKASVANITGVTSVSISENNTNVIDTKGLPPHSFKLLVTGGDNQQIANAIWQKKPAGIQSFGNIPVTVKDSNNKEHVISFSRAVKMYIFAKVTITKTDAFLPTSKEIVKNNMVTQINNLSAGNNVILNSLFASVFTEKGVTGALIEMGGTLDESTTPTLSSSDVAIGEEQVAFTDSSKIEIVLQDV